MRVECTRPDQIIVEGEEFVWDRVDENQTLNTTVSSDRRHGACNQAD
jgi:hypothetical protein